MLGMAGAYTAIATGIDGAPFNAASYASREPYETARVTYGLSFAVSFPGAFAGDDFFNNGRGGDLDTALSLNLGLRLQFANLGLGALGQFTFLSLGGVDITVRTAHVGGAYSLLDGALIIGAAVRIAGMSVSDGEVGIFDFSGLGPEVGVLVRPDRARWRFGAAIRSQVDSVLVDDPSGTNTAGGLVLPRRVVLPWEAQFGFAFQVGERVLNTRWQRPKDVAGQVQRRLARRRCDRALSQLAREGQSPLPCNEAISAPRDPRWLQEERARRAAEDEALDDAIDAAEAEYERARFAIAESLPRRRYLFSADLLLVGAVADGVGLDAFVDQQRRPRGESVSVGVRVGAELEPWANRLKVRVGSYLEPLRNTGRTPRVHGTLGADLRLFRIDWFSATNPWDIRVTGTIDVARDYFDWGVSVGLWH